MLGKEAMGAVPQVRAGRPAASEGRHKSVSTNVYKCTQFEYKHQQPNERLTLKRSGLSWQVARLGMFALPIPFRALGMAPCAQG